MFIFPYSHTVYAALLSVDRMLWKQNHGTLTAVSQLELQTESNRRNLIRNANVLCELRSKCSARKSFLCFCSLLCTAMCARNTHKRWRVRCESHWIAFAGLPWHVSIHTTDQQSLLLLSIFFSFLDLYTRQYSCCVNGFCLPLPMPQQSFHKCCLNILHDVCINGNYRDRVDHESRSFFMTTSSRVYWQLLSSSSCIFVCLWTRKYGWNCARPNWWTFGMWLKNLMAIKRVHLNSARISIAIWAKTNFSSVFLCRKLQRCSLALTNIPNGNRRRSERGEYQVELDQFFHLQPARPGDRVPTASYTISIIECVLEAFISRDALTWHHTHIRSKA